MFTVKTYLKYGGRIQRDANYAAKYGQHGHDLIESKEFEDFETARTYKNNAPDYHFRSLLDENGNEYSSGVWL